VSFEIDMQKFVNGSSVKTELIVRKIALELFTKVILKTPVGDPTKWASPAPKGYVGGHLRNNWFCSIGAPSSEVTDRIGNPAKTQGEAEKQIPRTKNFKLDDRYIYLTNNLPYAYRIDKLGWSKQAPQGMTELSLMEITRKYS
jgi:hypothetical protein